MEYGDVVFGVNVCYKISNPHQIALRILWDWNRAVEQIQEVKIPWNRSLCWSYPAIWFNVSYNITLYCAGSEIGSH